MSHQLPSHQENPPSIYDLVSSRFLEEMFDVSHRTIKRWEKKFNWEPIRINDRLLRYRKSQIEESLGVSLDRIK